MSGAQPTIGRYEDALHAEDRKGLEVGEHGYKYRVLEGLRMPPFVTPARYRLSRSLALRPDDVCFTSYPKSGSTWLSYILLLLLGDGAVPSEKTLRDCLHWVASSWTYPRSREELESLPSPRIFKSHMPASMAVGGDPRRSPARYVTIARNPKDVCVSYYHFETGKAWAGGFQPAWEAWLEMFLDGRVQRGSWFDHVLSWWWLRDAPNVHFLTYEDLLADPVAAIRGLAEFLGVSGSAERARAVAERTAFDRMRSDDFSNLHEIAELGRGFFRKGRVGSWKEQFTESQSEAFDRVVAERLAGSGLRFRSE